MLDLDRAARFLYQSNLIESIDAVSEEEFGVRLRAGSKRGQAGAFLAFMALAEDRRPLARDDLFTAHRLILLEQLELEHDWQPEDGLPPDIAPEVGGWRRRNVSVGTHHPPSFRLVPAKMDDFFRRLRAFSESRRGREQAIDFAADSHHEFERVHPFIDGNGRTGRLIANYLLVFCGLPLAVFTSDDRFNSYYPACNAETSTIMRAYFRLKLERPDIPLSVQDFQSWPSYLRSGFTNPNPK